MTRLYSLLCRKLHTYHRQTYKTDNKMNIRNITAALITAATAMTGCSEKNATGDRLTDCVNPLLGTATLWDPADLGYERHQATRTWGAEVFPGAALPCAMV